MKQIVLALANYSDVHEEFPRGTIAQPSLTPDERLSWMVSLLPFLEQENLYNRFDLGSGWEEKKNQTLSAAPIKLFNCNAQPSEVTLENLSYSSYVGMAGVGADTASLPLEDRSCGVFGHDRRTTLKDVKDGASNTLVVLETAWENGHWAAGGLATVRPLNPQRQPYIGEDCPFGRDHRQPTFGPFRFTSQVFVTNAALLDGSVRTLEASIDPGLLEALGTIAGNEPIPGAF